MVPSGRAVPVETQEEAMMARVLIVDDVEEDRLSKQRVLQRAGHEAFFAGDGEEALSEYIERQIDIVVTELEMPGINGFELIDLLRDAQPQPPVIAVSRAGPYPLEMARNLGAQFTFEEPVDPELLVSAVEELLKAG